MSTDWARVTGVITNIKAALGSNYRYAPCEEIGGKTAADILKQVDKILQSANTVLENHKEFLPANQFSELKRAYCRYHWLMTDESQEERAYYDKRIRESRILSQLYVDRATHHDRASLLLREVETYQTRVLSASRNAQSPEVLVEFEDEMNQAGSIAAESKASALQSYTSCFSVFGGASRSSSTDFTTDLEAKQAQSDPAPAYDAQGAEFIISVTHFPKLSNEPIEGKEVEVPTPFVGSGNNIYRRMIAFENKDMRVEITDSKLHTLGENETYVGENALQAMSELGLRLLNQADPGISRGHQITDSPSQTLSLGTRIQKFRKVSVAEEHSPVTT